MKHYPIIIVGGGNAGISVASRLLRKEPGLTIAIIDPAEKHYYQPAWTLVGGGSFNLTKTMRPEASVIPAGTHWIQSAVTQFDPAHNTVLTNDGNSYTYDYLVAAPGIQLNWKDIPGLADTLGKNGVTSNYLYRTAPYTFACIQALEPGMRAIFTSPSTPIKCGGAPQKIMYLAADYLRKKGILDQVTIDFSSAGKVIFGIEKYARQLQKVVDGYGIETHFRHDLVAVDGDRKLATFKVTDENGISTQVQKHFDMLHAVPPQSAPDCIRYSPLADANGWISVDPYSLQHTQFPNVFGIGDAISAPNSKTGAAVRKQAPVLVSNLLSLMHQQPLRAKYSGYGSCPIVTGYGKLILAEFDYANTPQETFPFDQSKPRRSMWLLKKYVLPWLYWHKILKGTM